MTSNNYTKGFDSESLTIILDSSYRNITDYPNVEDFSYGNTITSMWPNNKGTNNEKNYNMRLINIVMPYRKELLTERYFLVSISHTNDPMRRKLLGGSSAPGYNKSNFVVTIERCIDTVWMYLRPISGSIQTRALSSGGVFSFKIHNSNGNALHINKFGMHTKEKELLDEKEQISVIFEMSPSK